MSGLSYETVATFAQQGGTPPRPLTHDLMRDVLEATGQRLDEVRLGGLVATPADRRNSRRDSGARSRPRSGRI